MKNALVLIILLANIGSLFAQQYLPIIANDKDWYGWFNEYGGGPNTYHSYFSKDSFLIDDHYYHKNLIILKDDMDNIREMGYFREADGVVYQYFNEEDHVYVDMNLNLGDSVLLKAQVDDMIDSAYFHVIDVDTLSFLDDVPRKKISLTFTGLVGTMDLEWIEGIGMLTTYEHYNYTDGNVYQLNCFFDQGEQVYQYLNYCYYLDTDDPSSEAAYLYPNPTRDYVITDHELFTNASYQLYDPMGKLLDQGTVIDQRIHLPMDYKGVIIVNIIYRDGEYVQKIMKN